MSNCDLTGLAPDPATSELDRTLSALALAVEYLKRTRAAGADEGEDRKLIRSLARKAHRLNPETKSVNLLLRSVGLRFAVPEGKGQGK